MFADDIALVREMVAKYGATGSFVECGGLEDPVIAAYDKTIDAMKALYAQHDKACPPLPEHIARAQHARYLRIHRPIETACPGYVCEDPGAGGLAIEDLWQKYDGIREPLIGTAILLSVLEHVANPFDAASSLRSAMRDGGLAIVSVPFMFPEHKSPRDLWRFTPDALCEVFCASAGWRVDWADWRLRIGADAGVLDIHTMRPQAIESCACVARAA